MNPFNLLPFFSAATKDKTSLPSAAQSPNCYGQLESKPWLVYDLLPNLTEESIQPWIPLEVHHDYKFDQPMFDRLILSCHDTGNCYPLRWMLQAVLKLRPSMECWWGHLFKHAPNEKAFAIMMEVAPFDIQAFLFGVNRYRHLLIPHRELIRKYVPAKFMDMVNLQQPFGEYFIDQETNHIMLDRIRCIADFQHRPLQSTLYYLYSHRAPEYASSATPEERQKIIRCSGIYFPAYTWEVHDPVAFFEGFAQVEGMEAAKNLAASSIRTLHQSLLERVDVPWLTVFNQYLDEAMIDTLSPDLRLLLLLFPQVKLKGETQEHIIWILREIDSHFLHRPSMHARLSSQLSESLSS